ncbi:MAG: hypothetical protein KC464_28810, partial [Myxococcales bacterium]|nr:hypothetical protein [Myxococcales bacterium]
MRRFSGVAAGIFLCLAGCGHDDTYTDAAPGADSARVDATTAPDAVPTGALTVTTHSRCCDDPPGTLVAGIPVFVLGPDGALAAQGTTDATGTVTFQDVVAGSAVTAIYPDNGNSTQLVTVLAVKPDDHLVFGDGYTAGRPGSAGTGNMTITFPAAATATSFQISTECDGTYGYAAGTTSVSLSERAFCDTGVASLALRAYDSTGLFQTALARDVTFASGGSYDVPAWTPTTSLALSRTGVPAAVTEVDFTARAVVANLYTPTNYDYQLPTGGTAMVTIPVSALGDRLYTSSTMYRDGGLGPQESYRGQAVGAATSTWSGELPWVGQMLFNAGAQIATWIQTGDHAYDGAVGFTSWEHYTPGGDAGAGTYTYFDWTILIPPGVTTWTWSAPPAELAPYLPQVADYLYTPAVMLVDLLDTDGYDGLRQTPQWQYDCPGCAIERGELTDASVAFSADGGEGLLLAPPAHRPPWYRGGDRPTLGRRAAP